MKLSLQFHGATQGVTGSCHQLSSNNESLLIDCGIFQGNDERGNSNLEVKFYISNLTGLVLTHVHIDHIGRVPYLLAAGYTGPIFASIPTAYLITDQLEDTLKIGFTRDSNLIQRVIHLLKKRLVPCKYKHWITISDTYKIKFNPAGHILGSSFVEVDVKTGRVHRTDKKKRRRVVFSGDLGAPYTPILRSPRSPYQADILILEATYGNKVHNGRKDRRNTLLDLLQKSVVDDGIVIIPAFAVGRTQELLYELNAIIESHKLPKLSVIVDSPLANKFTRKYSDLKPFWDKESKRRVLRGDNPFHFPGLISVSNYQEHIKVVKRLKKEGGPAVVIAGSGMCTGGRVVNYLKNFLPDRRNDIIFIGYQGIGTLGRAIRMHKRDGKRGQGSVNIYGKQVSIKAGIHEISGYSAHAGQDDLVRWVDGIHRKPEKTFLVHGDQDAKHVLKNRLIGYGLDVSIARRKRYLL